MHGGGENSRATHPVGELIVEAVWMKGVPREEGGAGRHEDFFVDLEFCYTLKVQFWRENRLTNMKEC